jgi:hypothetical protein
MRCERGGLLGRRRGGSSCGSVASCCGGSGVPLATATVLKADREAIETLGQGLPPAEVGTEAIVEPTLDLE